MKLTECRCGSSDLSLMIDMNLRDPDDSECWIKCNDCGRSGKICFDVEDAIEDWKEADAAEIDNKEMQNRLDEMDSIFYDKILTMHDEPDDKPAAPGKWVRDEMGYIVPTDVVSLAQTRSDIRTYKWEGKKGKEMRSLAAKSFSTYSNDHAWVNKTGREILKDIEKLSDVISEAGKMPPKFHPGHRPELDFNKFGNPKTIYRSSPMFEFFSKKYLGKPFDVDIDIVKEPPRGLTTGKIDWIASRCGTEIEQIHVPTPGTIDIHFKGENPGSSVSFMNQVLENKPEGILVRFHETWEHVPYKPNKFLDVEVTGLDTDQDKEINEIAEEMARTTLVSKDEAISAINAMKNTTINAAEAGEKMREMCEVAMVTGETYDPSGEGLPLECKVMEMTTQGHVDSEKYPHKCDCGSACWNDGFKIECTNSKCDHAVKT